MRFSKKQAGYTFVSALCAFSLMSAGFPCYATKEKELTEQSSELQQELSGINQDIETLANQIAQAEIEIEETGGEIERTQELLLIAQNNEKKQYEDMKSRIKYLYENDQDNFAMIILGAKDMDDLLNKVDFVQTVNEYDRKMLTELITLKETIASQQEHLENEQTTQQELKEELGEQKSELTTKAQETSTDLKEINKKIETLKEQQRKEAEEKARKAAEEAAKKEAEAAAKKKSNATDETKTDDTPEKEENSTKKKETTKKKKPKKQDNKSSSENYTTPSGDGVLTKSKGVVYYNGHRETYYSQKVLPGKGLKIPGRHVASDGTIRDENGYICVASSDLPKGTVVQTSLGPGKVYDSGCASGTIDLYTDW